MRSYFFPSQLKGLRTGVIKMASWALHDSIVTKAALFLVIEMIMGTQVREYSNASEHMNQ